MTDDTLIHLDGLRELADRSANFHEVAAEEGLSYERCGVCTTDLLYIAKAYGEKTLKTTIEQGGGLTTALIFQFLAGFDLGYQARLERETRELLEKD